MTNIHHGLCSFFLFTCFPFLFRFDDKHEPLQVNIESAVFGAMEVVRGGKHNNKPRIKLANGRLLSPKQVQMDLILYLVGMAMFTLKEVIEWIIPTVPG